MKTAADMETLRKIEESLRNPQVRVWFTPLLDGSQVRQTVLAVRKGRNSFVGTWEPLERPWWLNRVRVQVEGIPGFEKPKVHKMRKTFKVEAGEPLTIEVEISGWPDGL